MPSPLLSEGETERRRKDGTDEDSCPSFGFKCHFPRDFRNVLILIFLLCH